MGAQRKAEGTAKTNLRAAIERLGPYRSFVFYFWCPPASVAPLKLAAVAIAGDGS